MQDEPHSDVDSSHGGPSAVTEDVSEIAGHAAAVLRAASRTTTEFRALVRGQPITLAVLMLGLGYVIGRTLCGGRDSSCDREMDR
jgi:hypothetical protein